MKQEDKDLLLKDLCGRLPYGVKCHIVDLNCVKVIGSIQYIGTHQPSVDVFDEDDNEYETLYMSELKPYLFPISSMTTDQRIEYTHIANNYGNIASSQAAGMTIQDWFDKNHIDYRGLIPKGLANDATNLNIY